MGDALDFVVALFVGGALYALSARAARGMPATERSIVGWAGVLHVLGAPANIGYHAYFYGGGDMFHYQRTGALLTIYMQDDLGSRLPEVVRLLAQLENQVPFEVIGAGTATGSMAALAGLMGLFGLGSLIEIGVVFSMLACAGWVMFYLALRPHLLEGQRHSVARAMLLLPSAVFWGAGLLKESIVMGAFGLCASAILATHTDRKLLRVVVAVPAVVWLGLFKPYLLIGLAAGTGGLVLASRGTKATRLRIRPLRFLMAAGIALALSAVIARQFPQYDVEDLGENIAHLQEVSYRSGGGSTYRMGDATARSLPAQMAFAPYAVVTALFRPFLFEARNIASLASAIEATLVMYFFAVAARRRRLAGLLRITLGSPPLAFCAALTGVLAVGIGLTTTNLGTLARYRMPIYPIFALLIAAWIAQPAPAHAD